MAFLNDVVRKVMAVQQQRVVSFWEPAVAVDLEGLAGSSLSRLRAALLTDLRRVGVWGTGFASVECLGPELLRACLQKAMAVKECLAAMARDESRELAYGLSLGGLPEGPTAPSARHPDPDALLGRLIAGQDLERLVTRSFVVFWGEVRRELDAVRRGETEPAILAERLGGRAEQWRGRLRSLAATTVHAVNNGLRQRCAAPYTPALVF